MSLFSSVALCLGKHYFEDFVYSLQSVNIFYFLSSLWCLCPNVTCHQLSWTKSNIIFLSWFWKRNTWLCGGRGKQQSVGEGFQCFWSSLCDTILGAHLLLAACSSWTLDNSSKTCNFSYCLHYLLIFKAQA